MWKALSHAKLVFLSLFYNSHLSWSYAFDTVLEPLFYLVDNFAKVLGPIFVAGAVLMTSAVVAISYRHGLPYYLEHKSLALTVSLVVLGNYILVNVIFHYVLAYRRGPGFPPNEDNGALPQVNRHKDYGIPALASRAAGASVTQSLPADLGEP